mmetsp:Transcript_103855/g.322926  ORF Transcript_103855/g.322926 Transcript_103855/m.322926 type:complete len:226 (+) Transcript_103855:1134-1811(+)
MRDFRSVLQVDPGVRQGVRRWVRWQQGLVYGAVGHQTGRDDRPLAPAARLLTHLVLSSLGARFSAYWSSGDFQHVVGRDNFRVLSSLHRGVQMGSTASRASATTTSTTHTTTRCCSVAPVSTCFIFGCDQPHTQCVGHMCYCEGGFCAEHTADGASCVATLAPDQGLCSAYELLETLDGGRAGLEVPTPACAATAAAVVAATLTAAARAWSAWRRRGPAEQPLLG